MHNAHCNPTERKAQQESIAHLNGPGGSALLPPPPPPWLPCWGLASPAAPTSPGERLGCCTAADGWAEETGVATNMPACSSQLAGRPGAACCACTGCAPAPNASASQSAGGAAAAAGGGCWFWGMRGVPPTAMPLLPPVLSRLPNAGRWGGRRSASSRWAPRCGLKGLVLLFCKAGGVGRCIGRLEKWGAVAAHATRPLHAMPQHAVPC